MTDILQRSHSVQIGKYDRGIAYFTAVPPFHGEELGDGGGISKIEVVLKKGPSTEVAA